MPITLDIPALRNELEILHLIVHRNKNQHRQAKWWKYVSIVHRNLKNLVSIPQERHKNEAKFEKPVVRVSRGEKKSRKIESNEANKEAMERGEMKNVAVPLPKEKKALVFTRTDGIEATGLIRVDLSLQDLKPIRFNHVERAEYLVYRVIPKAFNAFHRLIAHGQYVTLGLVLLATVARIWSILRQDARVFKPSTKNLPVTDNTTTIRENDDFGQVVRRRADKDLDMIAQFARIRDDEEEINMVQDSDSDVSVESGLQIYDEDVTEDETQTEKPTTSLLGTETVKRKKNEVDNDLDGLKFFG
ncbi:uncharacterized protein V1513DRAFT_445513 [Lipomyces chichibuensis]|uniref:uncharacterized protein n=1 Tax=Lipomyces chichibuensis TaxID=1546026 RepID=UPI0033438F1F